MKKYKNRGIDFGGLSLTDPEKYRKIYDVLSERGVKEDLLDIVDTVPLEYAYDLADDAPDAEDVVATAELKKVVTEVLSTLKPREERILRKRFGIPVTEITYCPQRAIQTQRYARTNVTVQDHTVYTEVGDIQVCLLYTSPSPRD